MDVSILGVPFNGDGTPPETENPARALRDAGLAARLAEHGHRVVDVGDLPIPPFGGRRDPHTGVLNQEAWRQVTADLARTLGDRLDPMELLLLLGGDCAIVTGVFAALRECRRGVGLVYLDGHADFRWPEDSPTGEPADLVLTALTGRIPGLFPDVTRERPLAGDDAIAVFGFREADRIAESAIATCDRTALRRQGIRRSLDDGVRGFRDGIAVHWLHFDIDVLDPAVMPSVLFPEGDGLSTREAAEFLGHALRTLPVLGISVACYHPRLDAGGAGARRLVELLAAAIPV